MKTKSLLLAAATLVTAVLLTPSQAQAGGYRNGGYSNSRNCGYNTYRGGCYSPVVVRPIRVVRPVRVCRPVVYAPAPVIRIGFGFGFGGGRCY